MSINKLDAHVAAYKGENLYDYDNEILLTWYPQRILNKTHGANSVLELGLGHGFTANIFSKSFEHHVILEGSPAVIQNFKEKYPECSAEIVETFFETFTSSEKFDVIIMGFILEHVDNPFEIISRYKHFLAPAGRMFIAVPNAEVMNRKLGHLAGILDDMELLSENDLLLGHKRYYTTTTLSDEIARAGYHLEMLEGIYLKPFTTSQMVSLQLDRKIIDALCELGIGYPELSCGILAEMTVR